MNYEQMRADIGSAVMQEEANTLAELATGKDVLEVGAHFGFSTIVLAQVAKSLVSVDYHRMDGDGTIRGGAFPKFLENLERYFVINEVMIMIGSSFAILPRLRHKSFDFIFIDGDHSRESVRLDILHSLPLLRKDGKIAFHDYGPIHFGVKEAVDELLDGKALYRVASLLVTQP